MAAPLLDHSATNETAQNVDTKQGLQEKDMPLDKQEQQLLSMVETPVHNKSNNGDEENNPIKEKKKILIEIEANELDDLISITSS